MHCQDESGDDDTFGGTIKELYNHWLTSHSNLLPFQFYVADDLKCKRCGETGTFHALKNHTKSHKLILVDKADDNKCGLCNFIEIDSFDEHFENIHNSYMELNIFNPGRMTTDMIRELRSINIHKKIQCERCDGLFETEELMKNHHKQMHPLDSEIISKKYFDNLSAYNVCDECKLDVDRNEFFRHLKLHEFYFKCSMCNFNCHHLIDIVTHDKLIHGMNSFNFHSDHLVSIMRDCYLKSKIVFGNGFVLTHANIIATKYDEITEFVEYAEKNIQIMKNQYMDEN